ncbi:unnamed protein product [Adineta steineri]|uniref:Uncharacterized protein n=1 Tax=Adineta steineri TaxID=433720 RepID=A0A814JBH4_9BILA|nr:unnamed protein product [Adineta steineri]CAF1033367.1 unnamed protein product [Adineta steineri]CAF1438028.1 unnamed protein product [Adineta steineri]CAF3971105.1 unnamed protein product [Adineta steineri]CAF4121582.1 unnamed protein product [Adineta steineri]
MRSLLLILVIAVVIVTDFAEEMDEQEIEGLLNSAIDDQFEPTYAEPMDGTDERSSSMQYRVKRARGGSKGRGGSGGKEHTKNARPSTQQKHEKGQTRKGSDKKGGEKGDARRPYGK